MKIIEEFMAKKEEPKLLYSHLKSGDEFIMLSGKTLRVKTDKGHVSFEKQIGDTYKCSSYDDRLWDLEPVERVDAEIRWCRR